MTLWASVGWSLLRAVLLAGLAWPCCRLLAGWIDAASGLQRRGRMFAVSAPFLFPELLVGYAYTPWVAGLPWRAELACACLLGLRLIPVGVVAWWLTPNSSVSASALHCRALCVRNWWDRWEWLRLWLQGPVRRALPAGLLMTLVAFQEFELAALLTATSWTDWLFVQQVAGMPWDAAWRASWLPCGVQLALLGLAALAVPRRQFATTGENGTVPPSVCAGSSVINGGIITGLAVAWLAGIVIPLVRLIPELPSGLAQLATQEFRIRGLCRELLGGLSMAVLAALTAWGLSALWNTQATASKASGVRLRLWQTVGGVCLVPGLLGSLVLSLLLIAGFQTEMLSGWYGTPLVWWLGLTCYLFPRAWLLQLWMTQAPSSGTMLADVLSRSPELSQRVSGRRLWQRLVLEPQLWAVGVLVWWGYLDLTMAYLLAPVSMSSGVVRLYNFMHFGRSAALSAEAAVLLLVPALVATVLWQLWQRLLAR